jgi:LAO/AO transport system kinase
LLFLHYMDFKKRKRLSLQEYVEGILSGNRIILSRALTIIESNLQDDKDLGHKILEQVIPHSGNSLRIGITGVPGVGKSTFIESFGKYITSRHKKLAVLAIDPSSQRSRGSILGDKTRMIELSHDPLAFIRPSPAGSSLGGVSNKTRESMLLCEAAGFEIIFIETVGVGQSETAVKGMVDFFLLLMLAGAGDELQGIKKGIMEMADAIAITKSDGENTKAAKAAKAEFQSALHLFPPAENGWYPKVLTCSALKKEGLEDIWNLILTYQEQVKNNGHFNAIRKKQNLNWLHENIRQNLEHHFYKFPAIHQAIVDIEKKVEEGEIPATVAAKELMNIYLSKTGK